MSAQEVALLLDAGRLATAGARDGGVIHWAEFASVDVCVEDNGLTMFLLPENLVVQHDQRDRQPVPHKRLKLTPDMAEASIGGQADDLCIGSPNWGSDREGQSELSGSSQSRSTNSSGQQRRSCPE
jgi:hypothetical protein